MLPVYLPYLFLQVTPTLALYDTMQYVRSPTATVLELHLTPASCLSTLPYVFLQVTPTLALYDTMQYVRSPTATVCYGMCLGMGGFLLTAGGEKVRPAAIYEARQQQQQQWHTCCACRCTGSSRYQHSNNYPQ
jgi:hypothetical protein